jgi:two-component system NtrC family sensor kinase
MEPPIRPRVEQGPVTSPEFELEAKILIVDDEPANVLLLERMLGAAGYRNVFSTTDSRTVLDLYRSHGPDLILLDLLMPHVDGLGVLRQLKTEIPADAYLPVLVLTADVTAEAKLRALDAGAHDFLTKPFQHVEVLLRIRNLLNTRRLHLALQAHNRSLEATVRDRTERLLQSEKVAAMGSLLAGVAHELNNPLTALSGHVQLLRLRPPDAVTAQRSAKISDAADRCVRIVRNFLALARHQPPERRATKLRAVVRGAVELLAYELKVEGVKVTVEVADDIPLMWADEHQLHQVLVNLVANAQQAMRRQARPRAITIVARLGPSRDRVRLEISDTGPGIPAAIQARIFEAFFTTKPPGEGTGLGLSLCRNIIEEHEGTLTVESTVDVGTSFVIELPVVTPPAGSARERVAAHVGGLLRARVLVVDDERSVAEAVAEALEEDGHQTEIAGNGAEALDMLERDNYDLIVSDSKMPVLDGERFYAELEQRFPQLVRRVIFLTGDILSRDKREFLARTGAPFLTKPFDLDEVRHTVQRALTGALSAR